MKNIAAYLLLQLGGKSTPTAADITSVLEAAGAEVDSSRIEKLISELEGKDINEVSPERSRAKRGDMDNPTDLLLLCLPRPPAP